jgi:hypothetical protein
MKISNILFAVIAFVGLGLFASCDVNDEFYNELDKEEGFQLIENIDYTLTDDDYDSMGTDKGEPGKYDNFSSSVKPTDFLPDFLADKYPTFDPTSTVNVTYKFYQGNLNYLKDYLDYLQELDDIESYTLTTADYDSMGTDSGQPGKYNNFSSSTPAEDYLPNFLLGKFPSAKIDDELAVTYKFYDGKVSNITEFWIFDGSVWAESDKQAPEVPEGVEFYELTTSDYDSMGTDNGEPGRYNNFDEDVDPDNYLSTFLGVKFPYASEGDMIAVLYKFYNEEDEDNKFNEIRADEYTLTAGTWVKYSSTIEKTDQYVRSTVGWVYDPSILYTMVKDDYQIIVDYVNDNIGSEYLDSFGTAESYYGAGSYHENFGIRDGDFDTSFDTWQDAVKAAIGTAFLPNKFPEAAAQVDGVDVNYVITFATYSGSDGTYSITFKCTKSGPNPEFEYVEGPTEK